MSHCVIVGILPLLPINILSILYYACDGETVVFTK